MQTISVISLRKFKMRQIDAPRKPSVKDIEKTVFLLFKKKGFI